MCNKRASTSLAAEVSWRSKDAVWGTEEAWEAVILASITRCVSILSSGLGSSVPGVMGKEFVPEDLEVERDARVDANGVEAMEEVVLVRSWEGYWSWKGKAARWAVCVRISLSAHF